MLKPETVIEALRESDERYRLILDTAQDAVIGMDGFGMVTSWNARAEEVFGWLRDEALGRPVAHLIVPERYREAHTRSLSAAAKQPAHSKQGSRIEVTALHRDGREFPVEISISRPIRSGGSIAFHAFIRDITDRKRAERELLESETRFRRLSAATREGVCLHDHGRILDANQAFGAMFGCDPAGVVGRHVLELVSPSSRHLLLGKLRHVDGRTWEAVGLKRDGSTFPCEFQGQVLPYQGRSVGVLTTRDVTERKLLESQLVSAQKLEAIGSLAAGVAHEINTPTQYVGDNTRFLEQAFADLSVLLERYEQLVTAVEAGGVTPELAREVRTAQRKVDLEYLRTEIPNAIHQSLEGIDRVSEIVRAMKEFSHPGAQERTPLDINRAIEGTITVARNEWKYLADVATDFDRGLPLIPVLPGEFNQVILNLIVNAAHAIADVVNGTDQRGTIRVTTRVVDGWAEIRIADTGTGIPEHVRSKIFDPFFTTKAVGRGTGQGLAIAHNVVVEKHGGSIDVETVVGKGSTFIIRLPLVAAADGG